MIVLVGWPGSLCADWCRMVADQRRLKNNRGGGAMSNGEKKDEFKAKVLERRPATSKGLTSHEGRGLRAREGKKQKAHSQLGDSQNGACKSVRGQREERNLEETGRNVQTVATSFRVKINQLNKKKKN